MNKLYFRLALFTFVFLFMFFPVFAQTSADIEAVLGEEQITFEQAAFFTLALATENQQDGPQAAFALVKERGWLPESTESGNVIDYKCLSYLIMKAFDLDGGLMYRLTGNQRYAYREMRSRGFLSGRVYSSLPVSGEQLLQILGNVTDEQGGAW